MNFQQANEIFSSYAMRGHSKDVDESDAMFKSGPEWYFSVGQSALENVICALLLSWNNDVRRVLDLPCGHGRVARHLRAAFPSAEMYFCDIDASGADYCARYFEGRPIISAPDLLAVDLPSDLDVIWVGSLFTHLDRARTESWLERLAGRLSNNGVLVATFHGLFSFDNQRRQPLFDQARFDKIAAEFRRTGYGYASYLKDEVTDAERINDDYGISISHPKTIIEIASRLPDVRILAYRERGWANNHDVLMITRNDRYTAF